MTQKNLDTQCKSLFVFQISTLFVCVCRYACLQKSKHGIRSPKASLAGSYELPNINAGNKTLDLHKSSKCS